MKVNKEEIEESFDDIYCPECGHCGDIGCCGIKGFIEHHVRGKTNCLHEEEVLDELLEMFDYYSSGEADRDIKAELENEK